MNEELYEIAAHDPDSRAVEPFDWERDAFREAVIKEYGKEVWLRYLSGTWLDQE